MLVQPVTDGPHETPRLVENGIPFISVDAIVDNKIDFSRKRGDVSEEYDAECCKKYKPQYHDVYVVKSGSTVGKVAIVETTDRFNIWSPLAALRCEGKTKPYYLFYLLQTRRMQAQILDKASNGTQPNLSMRELEKFDVLVTDNAEEQQRIGDYFKSLDHLITLHQRKCDETKQLKKFMLQKMFPKNGEKNPEIRFEGFTDDWEQRKLGEVSSKITKKNQDIVVDEVFTNSAEYGIISQRDFFDKDIANFENIDGYYIVEPNDFVYNPRISTTAPFGPIKRNKLERTGAMSPLYYVFRPHDIDLSYLECFFQTSCWHTFMRFNGNTGARSDRFAITDKVFDEMPISMPQDIEEQQKIGSYFSSLDNLITLHQRKCEKLKELKKFMLQNMFV